jgi:FkbM family methyltransferase
MSDFLYCHHIGGRGGTFVPPVIPPFSRDYVVYNYEPDSECVAQMQAVARAQQVDVRVVPMAVGDRSGARDIHINFDAYTSSVLPQNETNLAYQPLFFMDYPLIESTRLERLVSVEMTTLDEVCIKSGESIDVLSIDTQGFEYEVLQGADYVVRATTVFVICEVSFFEMYKGQRLFGDIHNWLNERGLRFERFQTMTDITTFRGPVGWRGMPSKVHGDALFVKTPEAIVATHPKPVMGLLKLAFVSLIYENVELAIEALLKASSLPDFVEVVSKSQREYIKFLSGMLSIYNSEPQLERPVFSDTFTVSEAFARFGPDPVSAQAQWGPGFRDRYLSRIDRGLFLAEVDRVSVGGRTHFERYLTKNGFANLAEIVAERRVREMAGVLQAFGWLRVNGNQGQILRDEIYKCCAE